MPLTNLRSLALALALVVPSGAARPATPAPAAAQSAPTGVAGTTAPAPAPAAFGGSFAGFQQLPTAPRPADGAVDLAAIPHTQPAPVDGGEGADQAAKILGTGTASFYGRQFDGRRTASGETFDMHELTAAHRSLPFGSRVRVTNTANGRSVVVRINDRGPFHSGRLIDLSRAAAEEIGLVAHGSGKVELALLED